MFTREQIESIKELGGDDSKQVLIEQAEQMGYTKLKSYKTFSALVRELEKAGLIEQDNEQPVTESNANEQAEPELDDSIDLPELKDETVDQPTADETVDRPTADETVDQPTADKPAVSNEKKSVLPENFTPIFQLMGKAPGYYTLPWWIYEWITKTEDWKSNIDKAHAFAQSTLYSLVYYIERDGSVEIRETRNSKFVTLT